MAVFPKVQSPCPYKGQLSEIMDGDTCRLCNRQVFDLIFGLQAMGRPFAAPPGVPNDRIAALRTAFMAMANDSAFRAEVAKLQIDASPTPGEAVQEFVTRMYGSPKAVIERAKEAISPN